MGKVAKRIPRNKTQELQNVEYSQSTGALSTVQSVIQRFLSQKKTINIPEKVLAGLKSFKSTATYLGNEKRYSKVMGGEGTGSKKLAAGATT